VSPVEIETELLQLPSLQTALAVGVPDPSFGQLVVLCAVSKPGHAVSEEDVKDFLSGRIARYKVPRRVLFFEHEDLTMTGNAKIRTDDLRALAIARLAVEPPA
jgi:acyl-CoA synthetase (AMP-forming)/AMP-acid ligase II